MKTDLITDQTAELADERAAKLAAAVRSGGEISDDDLDTFVEWLMTT